MWKQSFYKAMQLLNAGVSMKQSDFSILPYTDPERGLDLNVLTVAVTR